MKPCRQIKNDGEKLSYIKSSRKDSLQTWRWRRTEWSEGVFEKNWGKNIQAERGVGSLRRVRSWCGEIARRQAEWSQGRVTGDEVREKERDSCLCQTAPSLLQAFQSGDIIPVMLSTGSGVSPWIPLVFRMVEHCLSPLQERQWCSPLLNYFLFYLVWRGRRARPANEGKSERSILCSLCVNETSDQAGFVS